MALDSSHAAVACGSKRIAPPMRSEGILPFFASLEMCLRLRERTSANSSAVQAVRLWRTREASDSNSGFNCARACPRISRDRTTGAPSSLVDALALWRSASVCDFQYYVFPLKSSQGPLFRALGTPANNKKQFIFEGGHGEFPHPDATLECLNWLDNFSS